MSTHDDTQAAIRRHMGQTRGRYRSAMLLPPAILEQSSACPAAIACMPVVAGAVGGERDAMGAVDFACAGPPSDSRVSEGI